MNPAQKKIKSKDAPHPKPQKKYHIINNINKSALFSQMIGNTKKPIINSSIIAITKYPSKIAHKED